MINFECNKEKFTGELRDIIRMFVPFFGLDLGICLFFEDGICNIKVGERTFSHTYDESLEERMLLKTLKKFLYLSLREYFGRGLPWGSLTGIRPTKIAYSFLESGDTVYADSLGSFEYPKSLASGKKAAEINYVTVQSVADMLVEDYYVSREKAELTKNIIKNQSEFLVRDDAAVNLYVHIPFCPTRCTYCSFVSLPTAKNEGLIDTYLQLLIREIKETKALLYSQSKKVLTAYIGGGTPTILNEEQLELLLSAIGDGGVEFTLEAGRPDTITEGKLEVLKKNGISRICINPQSFSDETLKRIGRSHTAADIAAAMQRSRKFGFAINMDLIAGLDGETEDEFFDSIERALEFAPENITIHTLSVKNGSKIGEEVSSMAARSARGDLPLNKFDNSNSGLAVFADGLALASGESVKSASEAVDKGLAKTPANEQTSLGLQSNARLQLHSSAADIMVEYARRRLEESGYLPYYLYRQKNMANNLENVGYCLPGRQSVNNITVMEETVSVWGCGAGAISKTVNGSLIRRHPNLRDVKLYIENFEERLARKLEFLRDN